MLTTNPYYLEAAWPLDSSVRRKAPFSLVVLLLLFVLMVQARLWAPYFDTRNVLAILTWDAMGYYLYLPAKFIYNDLSSLRFVPDILREYSPTAGFYQAFPVPGGAPDALVMKYTCGLAVLWTPFFWLGHWCAGWLHYPQDGFSAPYQVAIAFGGLLYGLLGLGVLRRVLLQYFSDLVTTLVLVLLILGSNYFQYAVFDAAMAHTYVFTGYALLLWLTSRYYARPGRGRALAIGLLLGLMVLVRPSEAVAAIVPALWGLDSMVALRERLTLLRNRWPDLLLLAVGGLLGVLPQGLYWRWATGHWLFYSYGDQTFSFFKPHLFNVLFSYKKGWLLYSPLLLMPLAGFVALWRYRRDVAVPALAFFVVNLWVVAAWDIWWYGGSVGQRALVQSYAVLALPWGAAVRWLLALGRQWRWQAAALIVAVLAIDLNLLQNWQYARSIIHPEDMNRRYYWAIFNNVSPSPSDYALLDTKTQLPRSERYYQPRLLRGFDFENMADSTTGRTSDRAYQGHFSFRTAPGRSYSPAITLSIAETGLQAGQYVRASCRVYADFGAWGSRLVMQVERDGKSLVWNGVRLHNAGSVNGLWNDVHFDAPLPADVRPNDLIKVLVMSENGSPCYIDDLQATHMMPLD